MIPRTLACAETRSSVERRRLCNTLVRMVSLPERILPPLRCNETFLPYEEEGEEDGYADYATGHDGSLATHRTTSACPVALSWSRTRRSGGLLCLGDERGDIVVLRPALSDAEGVDTAGVEGVATAGGCVVVKSAHHNMIHAVCWAPDDASVWSCGADARIVRWDADRWVRESVFFLRARPTCVASCDEGGNVVASGDRDGCVTVWDARAGTRPQACLPDAHTLRGGRRRTVTSVCFVSDQSVMVSSGAGDTRVRFWDVRMLGDGAQHEDLWCFGSADNEQRGIVSVNVSPREDSFLVHRNDGVYYTYSMEDPWRAPRFFLSPPDTMKAVHDLHTWFIRTSFSPGGDYFVSGGNDAFVWDALEPGRPPVRLPDATGDAAQLGGGVGPVAWCPSDPSVVAACRGARSVTTWRLREVS